jgi:hypothetical protein
VPTLGEKITPDEMGGRGMHGKVRTFYSENLKIKDHTAVEGR